MNNGRFHQKSQPRFSPYIYIYFFYVYLSLNTNMYLYTISYEHIELSYSIFCLYWQTTPHTLLHHVWKDTHSQKLGNSGECTVCHPVTTCSNVHPARLMTCPYRTLDSWGPNQILSLPKCHQNIPTCCGRETTPQKKTGKKLTNAISDMPNWLVYLNILFLLKKNIHLLQLSSAGHL